MVPKCHLVYIRDQTENNQSQRLDFASASVRVLGKYGSFHLVKTDCSTVRQVWLREVEIRLSCIQA